MKKRNSWLKNKKKSHHLLPKFAHGCINGCDPPSPGGGIRLGGLFPGLSVLHSLQVKLPTFVGDLDRFGVSICRQFLSVIYLFHCY